MPEQNVQEKPTVVIDAFDGNPNPPIAKLETKLAEEKKPDVVQPPLEKKPDTPLLSEEKIFDKAEYIKKEYGWENEEAGKKELELLRQKSKELDLTNDDSKKVIGYIREGKTKELYKFLHEQEQIEKLVTSDLSDKKAATELVKFGISSKNKNLSQDEVDFLFNERFSIPEKPSKLATEDEDDYEERVKSWETQVANVEKRLVIEAKLAQPELEKLKSEIKLPDILKTQQSQKEPTPEELAEAQRGKDLFIQDAELEFKKFEGFKVLYKDKDVEIQSSYNLSDDEKANVLSNVKLFAEKGFDANAIFGQRWVKDGKFDFIQMARDLSALDTEEKRSQKFVGDAATKAKLLYMKGKHNIDIGKENGAGGELQLEDKERQKKNEDAIWN